MNPVCGVRKETKYKTVEHFLPCSSPFFATEVVACLVTPLRNSWRAGSLFHVEYTSER